MKVEKRTAVENGSLLGSIKEMAFDQQTRITTARETSNLAGLRGIVTNFGFKIRTQIDGDDVLVWKEKIEATVPKTKSKKANAAAASTPATEGAVHVETAVA